MNRDDYNKAVEKTLDELFKESEIEQPAEEGETPQQPSDLYQEELQKQYDYAKKRFPNGTNPKLIQDANAVLVMLAPAYERAEDDCELLKGRGDYQRAELVKSQYTMEHFLPAVESLVHTNTVDEVLNASKVLDMLDKYATVGTPGKGYTASYLRSAHADEIGNGDWAGRSDGVVRMSLRRINELLDRNQLRAAVGEANKIKTKIDKGEDIASQEDYEFLQRVIIRSAR